MGGGVCRWRRLPFAARHAANGWMVYRDRGGTFRVRRGVAVFLCRWMVVLVGSSSRCAAVRPDRSSQFSSTSGWVVGQSAGHRRTSAAVARTRWMCVVDYTTLSSGVVWCVVCTCVPTNRNRNVNVSASHTHNQHACFYRPTPMSALIVYGRMVWRLWVKVWVFINTKACKRIRCCKLPGR